MWGSSFQKNLIFAGLTCLIALNAPCEDWPHWRGLAYNGTSPESDFTTNFGPKGPDILWKSFIGKGYSSSVISDGKLFTMGLVDSDEVVFAFDAKSGEEIWKKSWKSTFKPQFYDGGTSGTPTIDGNRLYILAQTGEVFCLDISDGSVVWETNIMKQLQLEVGMWGYTGAPFVWKNSLILNAGEYGLALDKSSGSVLWSSGTAANGYATPVPFKFKGETLLAIFGAKALHAVHPDTGKKVWSYSWETSYDVNAADPLFFQNDQMVLISSGYGSGATLLDLTQDKPREVWKNKLLKTQLNAAVHHEGYFYGIDGNTSDKATLNCIESKSGELIWSEKNIGTGGLILANGHLLVISERGEFLIAKATPNGFKPTTRKQIYGGKTWTVPTLANGIAYCRNSRGDLVALKIAP